MFTLTPELVLVVWLPLAGLLIALCIGPEDAEATH